MLATKDWRLWDWEIVSDIMDGPVRRSSGMSEVMKTKFMARIGGFLRADTTEEGKGPFMLLPWVPGSVRFVRIARGWLSLLLHTSEGREFLASDRRGNLLQSVAMEVMRELAASKDKGTPGGEKRVLLFSPKRFESTLAREFLTLIGLASSSVRGQEFLESIKAPDDVVASFMSSTPSTAPAALGPSPHDSLQRQRSFAFLTADRVAPAADAAKPRAVSFLVALRKLPAIQSKDFLLRRLIVNFDCGMCVEARQCFAVSGLGCCCCGACVCDSGAAVAVQYWLYEGSQPLRLYATSYLRALLRRGAPGFSEWGIDFLVQQLGCDDAAIRDTAISVLVEASRLDIYMGVSVLSAFVSRSPGVHACVPSVNRLLFRDVWSWSRRCPWRPWNQFFTAVSVMLTASTTSRAWACWNQSWNTGVRLGTSVTRLL